MNSSTVLITFTTYSSFGVFRGPLVTCILVLYVSVLCVNILLVVVIYTEPRLHRPMYVLLAHLALSGLVGSTSVCPTILRHLLLSRQVTSLRGCLTQVFFINVYGGSIFCFLALMAYDRYVSICKPLLYHAVMRPVRVRLMLALVYLVLSSTAAVQVYLTSRWRCAGTRVYGLCCAAFVIALPCLLVFLSYFHIFSVTLKVSTQSQKKALQTCTPHLVAFINFSAASFFGVIYNRRASWSGLAWPGRQVGPRLALAWPTSWCSVTLLPI
ncbi:Olfactory receptor 56, partial [Takifugu flavidus]